MKTNLLNKIAISIGIFLVSSVTLYGAAKADLSIVKTASSTIVNQSSSMSYSMTVTNLSTSTNAVGVTVTDTLPAGMAYVSSSGTGWTCLTAGTPVTVTCTMSELEKNSATSLTLNVTAPTSATSGTVTFANTATVATSGTDDIVSSNNSSSVTVTLNRPPVAVNDSASTTSHTAVTGNVLTNDTDLDGDTKTVTNTGTFTLTYGAITIASNGSYTYTPGYFTGETDSFVYTISDGHGGTATAKLSISIASGCNATGLVNAEREFCLRKQTVLFGEMVTIGNTVVVPPDPQPASGTNKTTYCSTYTTGNFLTDKASTDNQALYMCSYKPDSYTNATSAELITSSKGKIKWAGLYLQSVVRSSDASGLSSMDIKIKKDGGSYVSAGAPTVINHKFFVETNSRDYDNYSAFIDVTSLLASKGWEGGVYTVANVPVTTDALVGGAEVIGKYGAWSLVVIYEDITKPLKSVSVYDGWQQITGSSSPNNANITVNNFYTPTSGTIDSKVSVFVGEGDKYRTGDRFKVGTTNLGTTDNAFDSGVVSTGSRSPLLSNNQGIDIKTYQIGTAGYNLLAHNQSSITFSLSTVSPYDYYYPSMLAFSTEVYQPRMCYYEDLYQNGIKLTTGAQVAKGSAIHAKVLLKNDMNATAEKVMLYRTFDSTMPYTSNSTGYLYNNTTPVTISGTTNSVTDALSAADNFDYTSPLFSLHAGNTATYNTGGNFVYNQTALFDYNTTANFDGNKSIVYNIAYTVPSIGYKYEGELVKCEDFNNTFGVIPGVVIITGNMNVIEHAYYQTAGSYAAADKNITTKITNKPFDLEAVYLDTAGNEKVYNGTIGNKTVNMAVMLYTTDSGTCNEERELLWDGELIHNTSHVAATSLLAQKASKDQRIKAKFIDYSTLINATSDLNCAASSLDSSLCLVPACLNSDTQILKAFPVAQYPYVTTCLYGDGGGAAPCDSNAYQGNCGGKKMTISPSKYNNDIGCAMCLSDALGMDGCSTDNFATRPNVLNITSSNPHMPNLLRSAEDYNTTINAYNFNTTTNTLDYNVSAANSVFELNVTKYNRSNTVDGSMAGTATFATSDFNMSNGISVKSGVGGNEVAGLTFDDVGKINVSVQDHVWSAVDNDDTPMSCDANGTYVCGDKNVTFIPDSFDFNELNITNNNGSPGTFTYIANEVGQMAGRIHAQIRALNKDGNVTANFATFPLWENNISIAPEVTSGSYLHPDANETTITNLTLGFTAGTKTIGWNETNTSQYLRFNFQRDFNATTPPAPFDVNGSDLNILAASTYTDPEDSDTAFINGSRDGTADGKSTFVYGRIIPRDIRIFGANTPFTANAMYEVFNAPAIGTTSLPSSKNESGWFINTLHSDVPALYDGDGNITFINTGAVNIGGAVGTDGIEDYTFNSGLAIGGYKAHINTDPWLWYGLNALPYNDPSAANLNCLTHPCFNINVAPTVGATGSAKSTNEDTKASKASTSGGTGWHSTTDYAPAIR